MATNSPPFRYSTSLVAQDQPKIRLLRLLPAEGDNDEIYCDLEEYHFDETCPEYEALSYVWGDTSTLVTIYCNDQALQVTESLYEALRTLRQETDSRTLWIDQITINQQDDAEKSHQVAMMRDIYRRSARTIAWLGKPRSLDHDGLATLRRLALSMRKHTLGRIASGDSPFQSASMSTGEAYRALTQNPEKVWGTMAPAFTELKGIQAVLRNSWFTRMWIVQEATVCPSLQLQSGNLTISFDLFVLGSIIAALSLSGKRRANIAAGSGLRKLCTLAYIRAKALEPQSEELELDRLIVACRSFKATDLRDRFYALYGTSSTDVLQIGLHTDYTVAARQAMISATFALLKKTKSLQMLELTECCSATDTGLPSWVPSTRSDSDPDLYPWSFKQNQRPFDQILITAMAESLFQSISSDDPEEGDQYVEIDREELLAPILEEAEKDTQIFDPNLPKSPLHFMEIENNEVLCLHGQLLDRIEETGPVVLFPAGLERGYGSFEHPTNYMAAFNDEEEISSRLRDLPAELGDIFSRTWAGAGSVINDWIKYIDAVVKTDLMVMGRAKKHQYPTGDSVLTAYRKVVCAGQLLGMTEEEQSKIFDSWRKSMKPAMALGSLKRSLGLQNLLEPGSLLITSMTAHALYDVELSLVYGDAMSCLLGRKLAWTAKGYLAMVPAAARDGDFVFSLRGSSMLFVLRRCGNAWKFLGPSWVHGMMERQLINEDACGIVKIV
ncbi:hypothetical protein H2198_007997 [Neophaeococcomyces mojaviensis]|uniref:Uncharacterized protein n=1 Tax=Neophaeococcomyces mojaviensis TaxID=3383035 RepID=A0ACC2ZYN2_9EURO|nr:hypothetical protein H2198_007997 [Knufia sp. JES_112]